MVLELKNGRNLTIGYAGGLHYGYGEQLIRITQVLRETGTRVEMFGPVPRGIVAEMRSATDVFTFNGLLDRPEDAWAEIGQRCDAIIQPYLNPPDRHERQYRTHFPSKLGDALSVGLPVLITGPSFASGVSWCLNHPGSSMCVTDPSPALLKEALTKLRENGDLRVKLASGAQDAAQCLDVKPLREILYKNIFDSIEICDHQCFSDR